MTKDEFNLKYWMFYMQLENDFSKTFNYVEFTDDNLSTYSTSANTKALKNSACNNRIPMLI